MSCITGLDAFDSREGCEKLYKSGVMEAYCRQLLKTNIHLDSLDDFVLKEEHLISKFHIVCVSKKDKEELMERLGALEGVFPISHGFSKYRDCRYPLEQEGRAGLAVRPAED